MLSLIALAVAVYLALVGCMYVAQRSFIYFPSTTAASPAESGLSEMQVVELEAGDGLTLRSWYRPAADGKPTIVYFHGNAGHVGYRRPRVRPYLDAGLGVLLVEYRGYGGNPGEPTEAGLYEDGRAAVRFLAAQGVGSRSTILYGESLGCGVAVQIAAPSSPSPTRAPDVRTTAIAPAATSAASGIHSAFSICRRRRRSPDRLRRTDLNGMILLNGLPHARCMADRSHSTVLAVYFSINVN